MSIQDLVRVALAILGGFIFVIGVQAYLDARADIAVLKRRGIANGRKVMVDSASRSTILDLTTGLILAPQMVAGLFVTGHQWLVDLRAWGLFAVILLQVLRMINQRLTRRKLLQGG